MLLPLRLALADRLDRCEARVRRVLEKVGVPQPWLHEFCAYRDSPRMTIEEFWIRYTLLRQDSEAEFAAVKDEATARHFYQTSPYMMWRNLVHRRHTPWRRVLVTMGRGYGRMLEYGCGVGPVSAYVAPRRPTWDQVVLDLPSAHFDYAWWRLSRNRRRPLSGARPEALPSLGEFHVVTALDVMEHLPDPCKIAFDLVRALKPGGYLHWNFVGNARHNDLDLATDQQRDETIAFLSTRLRLIWERDGYRVSRRP